MAPGRKLPASAHFHLKAGKCSGRDLMGVISWQRAGVFSSTLATPWTRRLLHLIRGGLINIIAGKFRFVWSSRWWHAIL